MKSTSIGSRDARDIVYGVEGSATASYPKGDYQDCAAPVFVHSSLDDLGLSPQEFRVYGHLARRAGRGVAFPAIASIAETCRIHPQTARRAVATLIKRGLITREM